ncbi:MAG: helix-turn-helix transcriptional regulator [Prevotella sp.]|jgi:hypothetical protein|nr:helix-turn-helix transcriptional regulator [Prevotella sp.]
MKKVKAFIERGNDGTYGVYVDLSDNTLNYGIIGDGKTARDAIDDFKNSYTEMKAFHAKENIPFVEAEFEFKYDVASFLSFFSNKFSLAGLQSITGINQKQLSHYVNGRKKPTAKTVEKIEKSIHEFANELSQVNFV